MKFLAMVADVGVFSIGLMIFSLIFMIGLPSDRYFKQAYMSLRVWSILTTDFLLDVCSRSGFKQAGLDLPMYII